METILPYAIALLPVLVMLWFGFKEARKFFADQEAKAFDGFAKYLAEEQGWLSFTESIKLLETGGFEYSKGFYAAQKLGDLPPCEHTDRAIRALISCMESNEPQMRLLAAISLGRIGDASAIDSLRTATESIPAADEISRYQATSFDKEFREARAQREGYSMSPITVSDPVELHTEVRQAATWAMAEIKRRHQL
jgi:hypothetical protein